MRVDRGGLLFIRRSFHNDACFRGWLCSKVGTQQNTSQLGLKDIEIEPHTSRCQIDVVFEWRAAKLVREPRGMRGNVIYYRSIDSSWVPDYHYRSCSRRSRYLPPRKLNIQPKGHVSRAVSSGGEVKDFKVSRVKLCLFDTLVGRCH